MKDAHISSPRASGVRGWKGDEDGDVSAGVSPKSPLEQYQSPPQAASPPVAWQPDQGAARSEHAATAFSAWCAALCCVLFPVKGSLGEGQSWRTCLQAPRCPVTAWLSPPPGQS